MRIVIDMQGAQTQSRFRGIGRYTVEMVQALLRLAHDHEIFLAFNSMMPESITDVRRQLGNLIQDENILIWSGQSPVHDDDVRNTWRRRVAEECYKTFLQDLRADLLFISSYFEGYRENAVTCVAEPEFGFATCVVVYDLIPLINADQYFVDSVYAQHYKRKLAEIQRAAGALTISDFSRSEALEYLAFTPDQIVNTYLGVDAKFQLVHLEPSRRQANNRIFKIDRPFILYAGGSDDRKNLPRLIQAFAMLPKHLLESHQLLLAGKFGATDQNYLQRLSDELGLKPDSVRFTGYISDDTLIELYSGCALFVFPSWHEGFGLPVLEAMACGAPVIAANCSSLPEVLAYPGALFNPFDIADISRKMAEILSSDTLRRHLVAHSTIQAKKFSWDISAAIAMAQFEQILATKLVQPELVSPSIKSAKKAHYEHLIERIGALSIEHPLFSEDDLVEVARCIEANQIEADRVLRRVRLPDQSCWYVNYLYQSCSDAAWGLPAGLSSIGQRIATQIDQADIVISPLPYPDHSVMERSTIPAQIQLSYGLRLSQTTVPEAWVEALNKQVHGVVVSSIFIRKLLIDAGVYVPIAVQAESLDHWIHLPKRDYGSLTTKHYRFVCEVSDVVKDGLDVLLAAYEQGFHEAEDISLLIVADSHAIDQVRSYVNTWNTMQSKQPEVVVLLAADDVTRKNIFLHAHCLLAPYRFQDVTTPVAQAIVLGLPVITTGWGAQTELDVQDRVHFIDYKFGRAIAATHPSHLVRNSFDASVEPLFNNYWAEPEKDHLAELMRQLYSKDFQSKLSDSAIFPCTQTYVASELNQLVRAWSAGPIIRPLKVGWVSTWNTRCGIASYSEHLTECMSEDVVIFAPRRAERISLDMDHVVRCWDHSDQDLDELSAEIMHRGLDTIVIQFNYGFFHFSALVDFLFTQASRQVKIVVTLHSTSDPVHAPDRRLLTLVPALKLCHRVLVHSVGDLNRLKSLGLTENVALFPLGVKETLLRCEPAVEQDQQSEKTADFVLASYGFFLPHKGLLELIDAVSLLRSHGCMVSLIMVNAEYPIDDSRQLIREARTKVATLGLGEQIRLSTDFLPDEESLALLQQADLVVYPYQDTGESASGAVRFGLAAMRPVAVTPLAIFDDVDAGVFKLPGFTAEAIAVGLKTLIADLRAQTDDAIRVLKTASAWCAAHQFPKLAARMTGILKAKSASEGLEREDA